MKIDPVEFVRNGGTLENWTMLYWNAKHSLESTETGQVQPTINGRSVRSRPRGRAPMNATERAADLAVMTEVKLSLFEKVTVLGREIGGIRFGEIPSLLETLNKRIEKDDFERRLLTRINNHCVADSSTYVRDAIKESVLKQYLEEQK